MSLIVRILLMASIGAVGAVGVTLWASSLALSRYWVNGLVASSSPVIAARARACDAGVMPTSVLRVGPRTVEFYARGSLQPARTGAPSFPTSLAADARRGPRSGLKVGGLLGGDTLGYRRIAGADRCGVAVVGLTGNPLTRGVVQTLALTAALVAALAAAAGAYLIVARPMLRRVAKTAVAAGTVGSANFASSVDNGWPDLARIDRQHETAHRRLIANEVMLAGRTADIERLLCAIAHDLKTPFAIIQLNLQQALLAPPATRTADIGRALAEVQYASALLENLELGAQLRGDDLLSVLGPVDLAAVVADSVERFQLLGASLGVVVDAAWPDTPILVRGDAVLFVRIITNLVHNALRHSGGKHVSLWVVADGRIATLHIVDDGIGMPPLGQTILTTPLDDDRLAPVGERARGLAIVRRLCSMMAIDIGVDVGPTGGTALALTLPMSKERPAPTLLKEARP